MNQKIFHYNLVKIIFSLVIVSIVILNLQYPAKIFADDGLQEWNVKHVTGKFFYSTPPKPDEIFNFQYRVINGTLGNLTIIQQGQYTAQVNSVDKGMLELMMPRNYPFSNIIVTATSHASVHVNGSELDGQQYSYVASDCFLEYSIPFSGNSIITLDFAQYPEAIPYQASKVPFHCITQTLYNSTLTTFISPLKQIQSGVLPGDVVCDDNFTLVMTNEGHSSACVRPDSAPKLVLSGWAKNPLSEILTLNNVQSNMTDDQKNKAFYDMMNYPKLKDWSSTGWTLTQIRGSEEVPAKNIHRTFADLYLPPNMGNSKTYCKYGWYAWLTVNTHTLQVENGTYPHPDSCTKQFQVIGVP